MGIKPTMHRVQLRVFQSDASSKGQWALMVPRHPSEDARRFMVRLLLFALYAREGLTFTRGLCVHQEPELWELAPHGRPRLWIEMGTPDIKKVKAASLGCHEVVVAGYATQAFTRWWRHHEKRLSTFKNLTVLHLPLTPSDALIAMVTRSISLEVTLKEGALHFTAGEGTLEVTLACWLGAPPYLA